MAGRGVGLAERDGELKLLRAGAPELAGGDDKRTGDRSICRAGAVSMRWIEGDGKDRTAGIGDGDGEICGVDELKRIPCDGFGELMGVGARLKLSMERTASGGFA